MEEISEDKIKIIKQKIKQFLIELGINVGLRGFKYWTTAILYAVEKELKGEDFGKMMNLYQYIGKKHKATVSKVEKDMRYIFESNRYIAKYFNVPYSIKNTAFLFLARENILKRIDVSC